MSDLPVRKGRSHGARLKKAAPWAMAGSVATATAALASSLIVARLLEPREFGIAALAISVSALLNTLLANSVGQALIRAKSADVASRDRALALLVGLGLFSAAVCIVAGWGLARIFATPELAVLTAAGGVDCVLVALGIVPWAILTRKMRTRAIALRTLGGRLAAVAATIALAVSGAGPWSLIGGVIANSLVATALMWAMQTRRPRWLMPDRETLDLARFGLWISAEQGVSAITVRGFVMLFGHFHGLTALGLLNFAIRLVDEIGNLLNTAVSSLALAYFSALSRTGESIASAFVRGTHAIMFVASPMLFGLAAIAPDIVPLVFGQKWVPAVVAVQLIALFWAIRMSRILAPSLLRAVGVQRSLVANAVLALAATLVALWLTRDAMFTVAVAAYGVRVLATLPVGLRQIAVSAGVTVRTQIGATLPALIAAMAMAFCLLMLANGPLAGLAPLARLAILVPAGVAIYGIVVALLDRREIVRLYQWVRVR